MDKCSSDAEFDSYWDYEAKNKNRNRIRVGRQYQATIPPLLKPGQKDGRKSEELETLKWKPDQLSDQAIEEYLSMAKGIGLFSKSLDSPKPSEKSENSLQSAIKGLSEFVTSHHPCHHDDGCKVATPSSSGESSKPTTSNDWSPSEAQLFAQALEACGKNFSAIKREYLPWKPIRSIIEYYYQGKGEKEEPSETETSGEISLKQEETVGPSGSKEEKPCVKEEAPSEGPQSSSNVEDTPKDTINFLENTRVTDPCRASPSELKMSVNENDLVTASSTVGSLNFFLGGRLVLKLNAQQDSGSGTKCQWVQSNDLPKNSNNIKKERHKKKCIQNGPFVITPESHKLKKKTDDVSSLPSKTSDCDPSAVKKPKLKSEYDFSESDKQGMLLCSTSWTPPVADGQEPLEVDDGSSKTSEGYVSPVLSYLRFSKTDAKLDCVSNSNSVGEHGEQKCDVDLCWVKGDNRGSSNSSENCTTNDSASKNLYILGGKNSPNQSSTISPYKQEVLNHKSALSHNKTCVKNLCYQPHSSHSSSPLIKQWGKWPTLAYPLKTPRCSLSPINVVDLKSPSKENPLDLSSKPDHNSNDTDNHDPQILHKSNTRAESIDKTMPSESESRPASNELSPQSSNHGSLVQSIESPCKETSNSYKCPDDTANDNSQCEKCLIKENSDYSPGKDSENSSQLPYTYCNLPYHYALPKCTKDYSLEEVPLDLSSANENVKGRTVDPEPVPEDITAAGSENSEAVERGMLYQLLKNKTSK